jgi:hypothetical protein
MADDYAKWLKDNKVQESADYDARAAFAAGVKPDERGHLPDTYKKPNHITYSTESVAAKAKGAPPAGEWTGSDKSGWTFKATQTNIHNAGGVDALKEYFKTHEPDAKLVLPSSAPGKGGSIERPNPAAGRNRLF